MNTFSYNCFNNINNVVVHIHSKMYKGNRKASRYKIGVGIIAVVENDSVREIIDFNKNRRIVVNYFKNTLELFLAEKQSSLAEDVTDKIPDAIRATATEFVIQAYDAAGMLSEKWLLVKLDQIYKYTGRYVNPAVPTP